MCSIWKQVMGKSLNLRKVINYFKLGISGEYFEVYKLAKLKQPT